jgi:hypothetical protein
MQIVLALWQFPDETMVDVAGMHLSCGEECEYCAAVLSWWAWVDAKKAVHLRKKSFHLIFFSDLRSVSDAQACWSHKQAAAEEVAATYARAMKMPRVT